MIIICSLSKERQLHLDIFLKLKATNTLLCNEYMNVDVGMIWEWTLKYVELSLSNIPIGPAVMAGQP